MQLNAGGILYGICHKKKNLKKEKKNSRKQPVIFENTYQSKRNPREEEILGEIRVCLC